MMAENEVYGYYNLYYLLNKNYATYPPSHKKMSGTRFDQRITRVRFLPLKKINKFIPCKPEIFLKTKNHNWYCNCFVF